MDIISNWLLNLTDPPVKELLSRHILVLVNGKGVVLDVAGRHIQYFPSVLSKLRKGSCIFPTFGAAGDKTLEQVHAEGGFLAATGDKFDFGEGIERFHTNLPVLSMRLSTAGRDRFLGVITMSDLLPSYFERMSGSLLYLDREDRIKGFQHGFYELFRERVAGPGALFDQPAGDFFSPAPLQIQESFLSGVAPFRPEGIRPAQEISLSAEETPWRAPDDQGAYLTLPEPVDLCGQDVLVRVETTTPSPPPDLILGGRREGTDPLDYFGYLLGPILFDTRRITLKKFGFVQAVGESSEKCGNASRYDFIKADKAFFVEADGAPLFRYYDCEFIVRDKAFLTLYLRPGAQCPLKRVQLWTRTLPRFSDTPKIVVRINSPKGGHFILNRFDNFTLSSNLAGVSGYRLQDVTELKRQVEDLETRCREQLKQERILKNIIHRYKRETEQFVGSGAAMTKVKEIALRVANSEATVLVQGQTGTGKEVLAKYIHEISDFQSGPFVKVDCSTLPPTLMESELFGHEKGAFTGALDRKIGLFERAESGSLFLDEVNNLTPEAQVKLLQFLNDFTITRVGGAQPIKLRLRLIAASGADLKGLIQQGLFREDLYYRIAVVTVRLPRLSERLEDLPELCRYFLDIFNRQKNKKIRGIAPEAFKRLYAHAWPGNVRELRNAMERAVVFCDGPEIRAEHMVFESADEITAALAPGRRERRPINASKAEILDLIRAHAGVVDRVAGRLGVTRRALYYHFRKLNIDPNRLRKNPHR